MTVEDTKKRLHMQALGVSLFVYIVNGYCQTDTVPHLFR